MADNQLNITQYEELPDGSARIEVEMDSYVTERLIEVGLITVLKKYIDEEEAEDGDSSG